MRGHGIELFDASWEPQLETAAAAAAMATLLKLAPHAPLDVSETGQEELTVQIESGRVAQSADIWPTQLLGWSGQRMRLPITSISLGQIPDSTETETRAVTGNWLLGIPAACSATAPAALEFMRWLTSPRQQLRLLLETGLPPTRISVMNDQSAAAKQPLLSQIAMVAAQATPRPRTHYYPAVEQIVGTWVAGAMAGLVSGEQALTSANRELTSVMQHRPAGAS
ncbi:MAG: hypothetical protein M3509_01285 [Chloroflexota bacterium]|nr:hypothetical protein [Chloroflexota bacterium]